MCDTKGENFRISISGVDEFHISHNNILIEACNTSFQAHLQVSPEDFNDRYNWAQMIAGPILTACTNSPLLLGNELWMETRIALFQQSCDIRQVNHAIRKKQPRVSFGTDWVKNGINDLYKDNVSKYKLLLTREISEDSLELIKQKKTPNLEALCLHNGTIYLWNRPCYGVGNGAPHIRIENRYLPSGPSTIDEVANLAFWVGLMNAMPEEAKQIWEKVDFLDVSSNFTKAARYGLNSQMDWFGKSIPAKQLILDKLLPLAKLGLQKAGINPSDILKYLGIIEDRVRSGKTGSSWIVRTFRNYKKTLSTEESIIAVTKELYEWQCTNKPVHEWDTPEILTKHEGNYERVDEFMNNRIITLNEDDSLKFAESLMNWNSIKHIAIENEKEELIGLITKSAIEKAKAESANFDSMVVGEVMRTEIQTVKPETPIKKAISLMKEIKCTCLPVIHKNELVGVLTDKELIHYLDKIEA
jgi:CBS domain-containing protein